MTVSRGTGDVATWLKVMSANVLVFDYQRFSDHSSPVFLAVCSHIGSNMNGSTF